MVDSFESIAEVDIGFRWIPYSFNFSTNILLPEIASLQDT